MKVQERAKSQPVFKKCFDYFFSNFKNHPGPVMDSTFVFLCTEYVPGTDPSPGVTEQASVHYVMGAGRIGNKQENTFSYLIFF